MAVSLADSPGEGGGGNSGQQSGRGGNHPDRRTQGLGGGLGCSSFDDEREYEFADDGRDYQKGHYPQRCGIPKAEYERRCMAVFQPLEQQQTGQNTRGSTTPPTPSASWRDQQSASLPPAINIQGPPGQQGAHGPPGRGGHTPVVLALQAQQRGALIEGQTPGEHGGLGTSAAQATAIRVGNSPSPRDYSGISLALDRLSQTMMDADTSRSLCWHKDINWEDTKLTAWKFEATSNPYLQFYAYMQRGEAFMVVGHSMSTIYSTTIDVASLHRKVVLFTGDHTGVRDCIPVILSPQTIFRWKTCKVIDDKSKLMAWYQDNPSVYGKLWDPTANDGTKVDVNVP